MNAHNYSEYIGPIIFILGALAGLYFRYKKGKPIPRYIHIIAFVSTIIGLIILLYSGMYFEVKISQYITLTIFIPLITYLAYGFHGATDNETSDFDSE